MAVREGNPGSVAKATFTTFNVAKVAFATPKVGT